jgi:hypothetical protein
MRLKGVDIFLAGKSAGDVEPDLPPRSGFPRKRRLLVDYKVDRPDV